MPRQLCLVHGNAFVPERYGGGRNQPMGHLIEVGEQPYSELMGRPRGGGRAYRGRQPMRGLFHAPLVVQFPADGACMVTEVRLHFVTEVRARLAALRLFDGTAKLLELENLAIDGDHSERLVDGATRFALAAPAPVTRGLCISVEIDWGGGDYGQVRFVAAGVVLEHG